MKLLLIDIETQPGKAYFWSQWDDRIPSERVIEPVKMLCFVAKWIGSKKIEFHSTQHDGREEMVQRAWELLDAADAVIHYNGKRFDVPHMNREFLQIGLTPPSPFKQIDLLQTSRRVFKFGSNKLGDVTPAVGMAGKVKHEGFSLWIKCMDGDEAAWRRMRRYNVRDVTELEELYEKFKPWIVSHPNRALHDGLNAACPTCSSMNYQLRGWAHTAVSVYQRAQCQDCGKWFKLAGRVSHAQTSGIAA